MHGTRSEERRRNSGLSDEQVETIATRAAEIALEKVYSEVGKGVVKRIAWIAGVVVISVFLLMAGKGWIKL